jgi:hypothetical protein
MTRSYYGIGDSSPTNEVLSAHWTLSKPEVALHGVETGPLAYVLQPAPPSPLFFPWTLKMATPP